MGDSGVTGDCEDSDSGDGDGVMSDDDNVVQQLVHCRSYLEYLCCDSIAWTEHIYTHM